MCVFGHYSGPAWLADAESTFSEMHLLRCLTQMTFSASAGARQRCSVTHDCLPYLELPYLHPSQAHFIKARWRVTYRSWLERQQNCPTCRASVFAANNTAGQQGQQQGQAGAQVMLLPQQNCCFCDTAVAAACRSGAVGNGLLIASRDSSY